MKTIDRYIFREITLYFALCLAVFVSILVTAKLLKLTSLVINKGVGLGEILTIFLSIVPTFLEVAVPVSVLLGIMLAFARLSADSEIIVIRASGISLRALVKPVIYFGAAALVVNLLISVFLRPWGYKTLNTALFRIASLHSTANLTNGIFNEMGKLTIYAEEIDHASGDLTRVLIDDRRDPNNRQIIVSKRGEIFSDEAKRTINIYLHDGTIHSNPERKVYNLTRFSNNRLVFSPEELYSHEEKRADRPHEMQLWELGSKLARLNRWNRLNQEQKQARIKERIKKGENTGDLPLKKDDIKTKLGKFEIEVVRKFSMPFACLVLALLAMPLGIQPIRSSNSLGATLSLIIGMIAIVGYYAVLSVVMTLSKEGSLSAYIGLWIPNFLCLAAAVYALKQVETEKWLSIVHGIEHLLNKAAAPFRRGELV